MAHRIQEAAKPAPTLRFLPRGTAAVQDYAALMRPPHVNRFLGWRWDGTLGVEVDEVDAQGRATGRKLRTGGRAKLVDQVIVVGPSDPHRHEYVQHARSGDLWCADAATAATCGLPFEPHFGGEHPGAAETAGLAGTALGERLAAHGFSAEPEPAALAWDADFLPAVEGAGKSASEKIAGARKSAAPTSKPPAPPAEK
jgi:hypothetical protein